MAVFQCKMCGGILDVAEGATIVECEYCGNLQTVPKAMDDDLQKLCNRANTLRIKGEFDKAAQIYEKIIQRDGTQSEAYWGLILCKYGIEYVDDPTTLTKIPTCHRASYDSIIADDDYKAALENADISQKAVYENQAREIDRIQKDILALSQKEEKYDVFICYKETDADGRRTQDSVIANDIYYQLTNEGFKVFYAAITLEGKLGSAYEPIIFAALNSAKVMLAIGTKPEYFNAVWVRNEWSRFLKIIKKDRSKLLIPCYRDMDAYELPEEFAHLQAQDMSKIGFINDIERGIKKVLEKDKPKNQTVIKETVVQNSNGNVEPLLKRVSIFLETREWDNANLYCEKVLDIDPENAQAYIGKLLAQLQLSREEWLSSLHSPIDQMSPYKMAVRFADADTADRLLSYKRDINNNIAKRQEEERLEKERLEREREEKARLERERLEIERQEKERLRKEEQERQEQARKERERKERENRQRQELYDSRTAINDKIVAVNRRKNSIESDIRTVRLDCFDAQKKKKKMRVTALIVLGFALVAIFSFAFWISEMVAVDFNDNDVLSATISFIITFAICYLGVFITSGFMYKANGKSLWLLVANYFTYCIFPVVYAFISLARSAKIKLLDYENRIAMLEGDIRIADQELYNLRQSLNVVEQNIANFNQNRT